MWCLDGDDYEHRQQVQDMSLRITDFANKQAKAYATTSLHCRLDKQDSGTSDGKMLSFPTHSAYGSMISVLFLW